MGIGAHTSLALLLPVSPQDSESWDRCVFFARQALQSPILRVVVLVRDDESAALPDELTKDCRVVTVRFSEAATIAHAMNLAAQSLSDVDHLWLWDTRHFVSPTQVLDAVASVDADVIAPVARYASMPRADTYGLLARGFLIPEDDARFDRREAVSAPGKGSLIIRRDVFLSLRGLDEGAPEPIEDFFELARRARRLGFCEVAIDPLLGFRLFANRNPSIREANRNRSEASKSAIDVDVERFITTMSSCILDAPNERRRWLTRRKRAQAICIDAATPPPRRPLHLKGTLWAIVAWFNPLGHRIKQEHFRIFRERLKQQGVPLMIVELAVGTAPFELTSDDADQLMQVRGRDLLWHKERLINLGVKALPPQCDKVAWLDADVLFERSDWAEETSRSLEQYVVVQPFSMSVRLMQGETWLDKTERLPVGSSEHEVLHSLAFGVFAKGYASLSRYLVAGHSGYAWAARRSLLEQHGLYDANILGNGDLNMAHAMFGVEHIRTGRLSPCARKHMIEWATRFYADVDRSVGYVDGWVQHLWHGDKANRRYETRLERLPEIDFDPTTDLVIEPSGVYRFAQAGPLSEWSRKYFLERREDG